MTIQMFLLLILDQTPSFYSPEETRILALKHLPKNRKYYSVGGILLQTCSNSAHSFKRNIICTLKADRMPSSYGVSYKNGNRTLKK